MKLALTFDDGPSRWTEELLDVLADQSASATFFVLGANIDGREATLRRAAAEGHEIGNHTWSHPELTYCDAETVAWEIDETTRAIAAVIGRGPTLFRAPYDRPGLRATTIATGRGLAYASFNVDPGDWEPGVDATQIVSAVLEPLEDGAIVDLHDGLPPKPVHERDDCTPTIDAVRLLLPALRERGYELVTVSELFSAAT